MTPPEHLLIGIAAGNVFYGIRRARGRPVSYVAAAVPAALAAVLPDIDSFFGHYGSRDVFIGHRGMTHSLLFTAVAALVITILYAAVRRFSGGRMKDTAGGGISAGAVFVPAFLAGITHLLADLPQPPGVWGGIPIFFPLRTGGEFHRLGGWSMIGWYDYRVLWVLAAAAAASVPPAAVAALSMRRLTQRTVFAAALLLLFINIPVMAWTAGHVARSGYRNMRQWNREQDRWLEDAPKFVRTVTIEGRNRFMKVFARVH